MGDPAVKSRFGEAEQGVRDRLDNGEARADRRRKAEMTRMDANLAAMAFPDYPGDVFMLIAQARSIARNSLSKRGYPRVQKRAAARLLNIYGELTALAASAPRDSEQRLQYGNSFGDLVYWEKNRPRDVLEIEPFSRDALLNWRAIADQPVPPEESVPIRPLARKAVPAAKPKPPAQKLSLPGDYVPDPRFLPGGFPDADIYHDQSRPAVSPDPGTLPAWLSLIKVPGMSYGTPAGMAMIHGAVIRQLTPQPISEDRAQAIVALLRDLTDVTPTVTSDKLDQLPVGMTFRITLQPSFFEKLKSIDEFKGYERHTQFPQRMERRLNSVVTEIMPDFTTGERLFFAMKYIADTLAGSGGAYDFDLIPGRIYHDGWMFIGFVKPEASAVNEPIWLMPDGRIFVTIQREALLEAFRSGVVSASGAVTLGWIEVAVGLALIVGPEALAGGWAALTGVGTAYATAEGAAITALHEFIASRVAQIVFINGTAAYFWIGNNWERVVSVFQAGLNIAERVGDSGVKNFMRSLVSGDPKEILLNWVSLLHDLGEGYAGIKGPGSHAPQGDDDAGPPLLPRPANAVAPHQEPDGDAGGAAPLPVPVRSATQPGDAGGDTGRAMPVTPPVWPTATVPPPHDEPVPNGPVPPVKTFPAGKDGGSVGKNWLTIRQQQIRASWEKLDRMTDPTTHPSNQADEQPVRMPLKAVPGGGVIDDSEPVTQTGALDTRAGGKAGKGSGSGKGSTGSVSGKGDNSSARTRAGGTWSKGTTVKNKGSSLVANENDEDGTAPPNKGTNKKTGGPTNGVDSNPAGDRSTQGSVQLDRKMLGYTGMSDDEIKAAEFVLSNYPRQMKKYESRGLPPDKASILAHQGAQKLGTGNPEISGSAEAPTGITVGGKKVGTLKSSDYAIDRQGTDKTDPREWTACVIEFKRTAGLKDGDLLVKGREFHVEMELTNEQVDAYRTYAQANKIPVFVVNRQGQVFAPTPPSYNWKQVGQWQGPKP